MFNLLIFLEEVIQLSHKKVVFMETLQWRSSTQVILEAFSSSFLVIVCSLVVVVSGNSPVAILCDPILGILVTFFLCYTIYPTSNSPIIHQSCLYLMIY